jgi:hypothetical protein
MKLATFKDGTCDGALAVVSRDLTKAVRAEAAVAGLRTARLLLDDWPSTHLKVERIYAELNESVKGRRLAPLEIVGFDESRCAATCREPIGGVRPYACDPSSTPVGAGGSDPITASREKR